MMEEPRRLLIAGDTHGDIDHVRFLYRQAAVEGCQAILQLGDFGFWEHTGDGERFLDQVSDLGWSHLLPLYWLDGNHENHELLRAKYLPRLMYGCDVGGHPNYHTHRHTETAEGFWPIRPWLAYIPRGTRWSWHGRRFMAVGGAYSIDKHLRHEGISWWPQEELTEAELARICTDTNSVEVLFTHDAPAGAEPAGLLDIPASLPHRRRLRTIAELVRPKLVFHGHHHKSSVQTMTLADGFQVAVFGLASNFERRGSYTSFKVGP